MGDEPSGEGPRQTNDGSVESWLREIARVPTGEAPLPQPGQVVGGKYRIEELLGKGGMGAVYRAKHVVSDKQVAVKWMLRPDADQRAMERFTREARAAGRIDHPNVVDVYDIGQEGQAGYLVMELLWGESLRHRLAGQALTATEVVDLLLPAMRGVAAAHREGVIHRDLKPDNIFLCRGPDGSEREAKVLDFGISTISTPELATQTTLTKEGTVLGTPSYMSPEQLEDVRNADARADVYAFGVILYEALTGRVPYSGESYSALVLAIANDPPRAPRELQPDIPAAIERLILQAIDKDRDRRVQSMDALITQLAPFASVKSVGAGERASAEPERSPQAHTARSRTAVAALSVVVLSALAWWMWSGRSSDGAPPATTTTVPGPEHATTTQREPPPATPAPPAATQPPPMAAPAAAQPPRVEAQSPAKAAASSNSAAQRPRTSPAPRPAEAPPTKASKPSGAPASRARAEGPSATEPAPAPPPPPAPKVVPARSGNISMEDL